MNRETPLKKIAGRLWPRRLIEFMTRAGTYSFSKRADDDRRLDLPGHCPMNTYSQGASPNLYMAGPGDFNDIGELLAARDSLLWAPQVKSTAV